MCQQGITLGQQSRYEEAQHLFLEAIALVPHYPEAYYNLGVALKLQDKPDEAIAAFETALAQQPHYPNALLNLGVIAEAQGKSQAALSHYRRVLRLEPNHADAHHNLAMVLLRLGDFRQGFAEYEWRWQLNLTPEKRALLAIAPLWDGSDLAGRTLFVHAEQGYGDTIQFIRYLSWLKPFKGRIILGCPAPLRPILLRVEGIDQIIEDTTIPRADVRVPLISLARLAQTTVDSIPAAVPYLSPPPEPRLHLECPPQCQLQVGIVWATKPQHPTSHQRSCALTHFLTLGQRFSELMLYSLQKEIPPADVELLQAQGDRQQLAGAQPLQDLSTRLQSFDDTAAVIAQLDLVITVDTAVAHLAGALGKPVWVLLPAVADWRWLQHRSDSPWYPTMRLFRQQRPGEWDAVFMEVSQTLARVLNGASPVFPLGDKVNIEHPPQLQAKSAVADWMHQGETLFQAGEFAAAKAAYAQAYALDPDNIDACSNLGVCQFELGELEDARQQLERAITLQPENATIHYRLGIILLLCGEFERGWREYAWLIKTHARSQQLPTHLKWEGQSLKGKTLILWSEQGYGDTLQFIRYVPLMARLAGQVLLDVQSPLRRLLQAHPSLGQVMDPQTSIQVHAWSTFSNLPRILDSDSGSLENHGPYLTPLPEVVIPAVVSKAKGFKIGLAWKGSPGNARDSIRSIALPAFKSLLSTPGCSWFSLHHHPCTEEIEAADLAGKLIDLAAAIEDFADLATVISHLDLVISVDTAVAHLAGAMGRPVWLLLPFIPDWRWGLVGQETAWYPTMTLFRQPSPNDWLSVVAQVNRQLASVLVPGNNKVLHWSDLSPAPLPNPDLTFNPAGQEGSNAAIHSQLQSAARFVQAGDLKQAELLYHAVLKQSPDHAYANFCLGYLYQRLDHLSQAIEYYQQAIHNQPDYIDALNNLGNVYEQEDRLAEAIASYQNIIQLRPDHSIAYYNLGVVYERQGKAAQAVESYQKAIELNSSHVSVYNNLGNLYEQQERWTEAIACYQKVLQLRPEDVNTYHRLGVGYQKLGDYTLAPDYYRKVLASNPTHATSLNNLAILAKDQGKLSEALDLLHQVVDTQPSHTMAWSNLLLILNYSHGADPSEIYAEHQRWGDYHAAPFSDRIQPHVNDPTPARPLRIGYLSGDLRKHSVTYFFEPLLAKHTRSQFEIICYAQNKKVDATTQRLQRLASEWCPIYDRTDEQVAKQIRQDQIDILVDLSGHTGNHRLLVFARQPAPIQVTYLGYPNTTGLSAIHYRFTDGWADPEGADHRYTEQLMRLPHGFLCYQPPSDCPTVSALPALTTGQITFASFNNLAKVNPQLVAHWAVILKAVPGARMIVKSKALTDLATREYWYSIFETQGIGRDRLELLGWTSYQIEHLTLYHKIDIALDTFPYHGTTTTCEAMWMGVPVITLAGRTHAARVGVSLLSSVGLQEFIAESPEDYIHKAIHLASNLERLQQLRVTLRERMQGAPLTNARLITQSIESAYRTIWTHWCQQSVTPNKRDPLPQQDHAGKRHSPSPQLQDLFEQAKRFQQRDQRTAALDCYRQAIALDPSCAAAHINQGVLYQHQGQDAQAIRCYQRAIDLEPTRLVAHRNLTQLWRAQQEWDLAIAHWQSVLTAHPQWAAAHAQLGQLWLDRGQLEQAIETLQQAITLDPSGLEPYISLGNAWLRADQPAAAEQSFRQALALVPDSPTALSGLAVALAHQGHVQSAKVHLEQALTLAPQHQIAHENLGMLLLTLGDWGQGFAELEWRWQCRGQQNYPDQTGDDRNLPQILGLDQPLWQGEPLTGKTILVYAEQGLGDTLQFIRYVPLLAQRGGRVLFHCYPVLQRLLATVEGIEAIIPEGNPLPSTDFCISLLSLPHRFGTTLETIPNQTPYLQVPRPVHPSLPPTSQTHRVGLVWAANLDNPTGRKRSCALAQLLPLLAQHPEIHFFSLQKVISPEDQTVWREASDRLTNLEPLLQDFADTAAVVAQLDLVISVDTAVAHLGGAMGQPVWVLLPAVAEWRWLQDREDSPWYPTLRLFRQPQPGGWAAVLNRVSLALEQWVLEDSPIPPMNRPSPSPPASPAPSSPLQQALQLHHGGDAAAAAQICHRHLASNPGDIQIRYLLAITLSHQGEREAAMAQYEQVLAQDPAFAPAHYSLGNLCAAQNQVRAAIAHYHQALTLQPHYPKAQAQLDALLARAEGSEAVRDYHQQCLTQDPHNTAAHLALGRLQRDRQDGSQALHHFQAALAQAPDSAEAHLYLGVTQYEQGQRAEGTIHVKQALQLNPNSAVALAAMGNILLDRHRVTAAITHLQRSLALQPNAPEALNALGKALTQVGQLADGEVYLRRCLQLKPDFPIAACNLGELLIQQQQFTAAIAIFESVLAADPDSAEAHANLGLARLRQGDYRRGFAEYEWRGDCLGDNGKPLFPAFPLPRWDGSDPAGKTLLLFGEQGFGDMIQFIRFAPLLQAQGAQLILNCPRILEPLLGPMQVFEATLSQLQFPLPAHRSADAWVPLMSLPHLLNITLENLPHQVPYLQVPESAEVCLPGPMDGRRPVGDHRAQAPVKIGIVWACRPDHSTAKRRSCPLEQVIDLVTAFPDISFYSLQKEVMAADLPLFESNLHQIEDLRDQLQDFGDTAAAIAQLDLVITVDTAVAHLAGALGKPTWVLLAAVPDWRWLTHRDDCPWYPTMRLFRQDNPGHWQSVWAQVYQALSAEFSLPCPTTPHPLPIPRRRQPLCIGWPIDPRMGWGNYGVHLALQLQTRKDVAPVLLAAPQHIQSLNPMRRDYLQQIWSDHPWLHDLFAENRANPLHLPFPVFHSLGDGFCCQTQQVKGDGNIGIVFLESTDRPASALAQGQQYDFIVAGSAWNQQLLQSWGLDHTHVVFQGIDPSQFHPAPKSNLLGDRFVLFSGGKLEYRKGQDLVIAAFRQFVQRHPDALLLTAWHNFWPQYRVGLDLRGHVQGMPKLDQHQHLQVKEWLVANGVPAQNCIVLDAIPNASMAEVMREADVALFPNRCEGGTNLVAMECCACGIPCILSKNTGHLDIIDESHCYPLHHQQPAISNGQFTGVEGWGESDVDEIVDVLEQVYTHREEVRQKGEAAAAFMQDWTWEKQISRFCDLLTQNGLV